MVPTGDEWFDNDLQDVLEAVEVGLPNQKVVYEMNDAFIFGLENGFYKNIEMTESGWRVTDTPLLSSKGTIALNTLSSR